jgi:hypothetical protein
MIEVPLTQGKVALIDDVDYELISQHNWCANKDHHYNRWYAVSSTSRKDDPNNKQHQIKMHRLIMSATSTQQVDHVNGDGLDNRRENIRCCTKQENHFNRNKHKSGYSIYKGISYNKKVNKWMARIRIDKKLLHLGYFLDEIEAAMAYDEAALKYFGEFANLNFKE